MIKGNINDDGEAIIRVTVRGPTGRQHRVEAVVDTGFTDWLSLPPDLISRLRLPWWRRGSAILADGTECYFDTYEATVIWDRRHLLIPVYELEATPLVGTALMSGYELNANFETDGEVTTSSLTRRRRR